MNQTELVLQFAAHFGQNLLANGGTLERANDKMKAICTIYNLKEVSVLSLSSYIQLGAVGEDGEIYSYRTNVTPMGINVEKLSRYNDLSYKIAKNPPKVEDLEALLEQAGELEWDYPFYMSIVGFILALGCICMMFGGTLKDVLCVAITTIVMSLVSRILASPGMTTMLKNIINMFIAGCLGLFYVRVGIGDNIYTILLTNAFMLIPGIQLVNSIRNILRGNEMNGIIELIKVLLETFAIVIGIFLSVELIGGMF